MTSDSDTLYKIIATQTLGLLTSSHGWLYQFLNSTLVTHRPFTVIVSFKIISCPPTNPPSVMKKSDADHVLASFILKVYASNILFYQQCKSIPATCSKHYYYRKNKHQSRQMLFFNTLLKAHSGSKHKYKYKIVGSMMELEVLDGENNIPLITSRKGALKKKKKKNRSHYGA